MGTGRILVIDDEPDIRVAVQLVLERAGLTVETAADGREGLRQFHKHPADLVVLDVMLPGLDGWAVLERLRDISDVPILMLTAKGLEQEKVRGLREGADDYLTKPFGNAELAARVTALLRRSAPAHTSERYEDTLLTVDFTSHTVEVAGQAVQLTPSEFRVLRALVQRPQQILTQRQLLELGWDDPFGVDATKVKYAVMRLRRKLGVAPGGKDAIESVRGFGYRYVGANAISD